MGGSKTPLYKHRIKSKRVFDDGMQSLSKMNKDLGTEIKPNS